MKTANFSACAPKKKNMQSLEMRWLEIDVTFKQRCVGEILDSCLGWWPWNGDTYTCSAASSTMIRTWAGHLAPAGSPRLLVRALGTQILYWKIQKFRVPAICHFFTTCCACHEKSPCSGGGDVVMWSGQMWWGAVRCTERDVVMCCEMWWCWNFGTAKLLN